MTDDDQGTDESGVVSAAGDLAARVVGTATHDIGGFIRAQRESAQVSLRQLALLAGVSNPYLSQIERGLRKPSAEVLSQIAKGLRVSSEVLYVQAGFLEERPHSPIADAVLSDVTITERQKQVLMEIYDSFRRENEKNVVPGTAVPDPDVPDPDVPDPDVPDPDVPDPDVPDNDVPDTGDKT